MLEYSLTSLVTVVSTVIVIMASVLFCCWRKKDAGENDEREKKKSTAKTTKEENMVTVCAAGKSENGSAVVQSVPQCEMKVPLLSSPALEDFQDELGDFSAVQRETDILRTYRKAKPPKRARQSRAPKVLQTGRDSVDIFSQLNEDDSVHGSDKENTDSTNDVDSILSCQDKRKSQRSTFCSMLADIDLTLAALHGNEQSNETILSAEDKPNPAGQASQQDPNKDKAAAIKNSEPAAITLSPSESTTSSLQPCVPSEVKTQPTAEKVSPKFSPIAKPRKIPKANPKPSPKPRAVLEQQDGRNADNKTLENPSEAKENILTQSGQERQPNTQSLDAAPEIKIKFQPKDSEKGNAVTSLVPKVRSPKHVSNNKTVTNNETTHAHSQHESPLQAGDSANQVLTENKKAENTTLHSLTSSSSSDDLESSIVAPTPETNKTNKAMPKNTSKGSNINNRKKDSHSHQDENPQSQNQFNNNEEKEDNTKNQIQQMGTTKSETANSNNRPRKISRQTSSDREASPPKHKDASRGRSEETRKQRRESNEDQTGKGKTSKIPVRAGSKPRSTSPKTLSPDKVAA